MSSTPGPFPFCCCRGLHARVRLWLANFFSNPVDLLLISSSFSINSTPNQVFLLGSFKTLSIPLFFLLYALHLHLSQIFFIFSITGFDTIVHARRPWFIVSDAYSITLCCHCKLTIFPSFFLLIQTSEKIRLSMLFILIVLLLKGVTASNAVAFLAVPILSESASLNLFSLTILVRIIPFLTIYVSFDWVFNWYFACGGVALIRNPIYFWSLFWCSGLISMYGNMANARINWFFAFQKKKWFCFFKIRFGIYVDI